MMVYRVVYQLVKSGRLRPAMKGSKGAAGVVFVVVPLVVFPV